MDEGPGVFLCDGRREDFEDLAEVEAVVRVERTGIPHDYTLQRAGSLASYLTHCWTENKSAKK